MTNLAAGDTSVGSTPHWRVATKWLTSEQRTNEIRPAVLVSTTAAESQPIGLPAPALRRGLRPLLWLG